MSWQFLILSADIFEIDNEFIEMNMKPDNTACHSSATTQRRIAKPPGTYEYFTQQVDYNF